MRSTACARRPGAGGRTRQRSRAPHARRATRRPARIERALGRVESCAVLRDEHHPPRRELGEQPAVDREEAREAHRRLRGIIEKGDDQSLRAARRARSPADRRRRKLPQARHRRAMAVIALLGPPQSIDTAPSEIRAPLVVGPQILKLRVVEDVVQGHQAR